MDKSVSESDKDNEEFTIIDEGDLDDLLNGPEDELKHIINQIDDLKLDLNQSDIKEVVTELRHLEEKLHLWREVRTKTISELREIADYIDKISKQTGIAKVKEALMSQRNITSFESSLIRDIFELLLFFWTRDKLLKIDMVVDTLLCIYHPP